MMMQFRQEGAVEQQATLKERYEAAIAGLAEPGVIGDAGVEKLRSAFLARWRKLHREGLSPFSDREREHPFAERVQALLRKRKALVSLMSQALAREEAAAAGELKELLRFWITAHDAVFEGLVEEELARLRGELTRAFEARRALGAYAQTLQYRGG